jgi:hypothetical protein
MRPHAHVDIDHHGVQCDTGNVTERESFRCGGQAKRPSLIDSKYCHKNALVSTPRSVPMEKDDGKVLRVSEMTKKIGR